VGFFRGNETSPCDVTTSWGKGKGKCLGSHQIIFYFYERGHISGAVALNPRHGPLSL
jgi:hypothetical protein